MSALGSDVNLLLDDEWFARAVDLAFAERYAKRNSDGPAERIAATFGIDMARESLANVAKFSRSPVEKMFFNAVVMSGVMAEPCFAVILGGAPVSECQKRAAESTKAIDEMLASLPKDRSPIEALENLGCSEEERFEFFYLSLVGSHVPHIIVQAHLPEIVVDGRSVCTDGFVIVPRRPSVKIAVEIDGFDYHSDREAFSRDRAKDRALAAAGITVLRYSGSEVYRNPAKVSIEFVKFVLAVAER